MQQFGLPQFKAMKAKISPQIKLGTEAAMFNKPEKRLPIWKFQFRELKRGFAAVKRVFITQTTNTKQSDEPTKNKM